MDDVAPYGRLTFLVKSQRKGIQPHLVDLASFKGNGQCDCEDFRCRKQKPLENGEKPANEFRCRHILQAREWMLDRFIKEVSKCEASPHHD